MIELKDKDLIFLEKENSKFTFTNFITLLEESHNLIIFSKNSNTFDGYLNLTKKVNLSSNHTQEDISSNLFKIDLIFINCLISDITFLYNDFRKVTNLPIVFVISYMDKEKFLKLKNPLIKNFYNKILIFSRERSSTQKIEITLEDYIISDFEGSWKTSLKNIQRNADRQKIISQILDK